MGRTKPPWVPAAGLDDTGFAVLLRQQQGAAALTSCVSEIFLLFCS